MASYEWPPSGGTNSFDSIILLGSTSGSLTLTVPAVVTSYTLTFPATQGAAGTSLVNNGSGILSWEAVAGLTVGTYDSQPGVANGLQIVNDVLYAQSATAIVPGMVNTTTQSFAGNKTFTGTISASNLSGTNTGDVTIGTSNGLSLVGQVLSLGLSSTSSTGALSSTDWNTFNNKQAAGNYITALTGDVVATGPGSVVATIQANVVTNAKLAQMPANTVKANTTGSTANAADVALGTVTESTSSVLVLTGWADATIGSPTIQVLQASGSQSGYLSSADWTTFNSKQAAGNYITALTGDGTATGPGSVAFTLATVNSNVGTFGTASAVGTFTVNGKGLITAASSTSIQIAESQVTNLVSDLAGKQPTGNYITALTGDVTATGPGSVVASLTATSNATLTTLSALTTATSLASVGTITTGTWNATTIAIAHGGTGATTAAAAYNNLSPMTTTGDMEYEASANTAARLPIGTTGQVLTVVGGIPAWTTASSSPTQAYELNNLGLATSVASNALTIALKQSDGATDPSSGSPVNIGFRSTTAATGSYTIVASTAATSLVVPSGATLGSASGLQGYLYVYAVNNAGTVVLGVSGIRIFDELSLQTTTAISSSATSGDILYTSSALTNVAIRLIGRAKFTETTAGTWASNVSELSLQALSGSTALVGSQTVSALYTNASGTVNNTFTNVATYGTKVVDTHNAYSSGIYTIPVGGTYSIEAQIDISGTFVVGTTVLLGIGIGGTATYVGADKVGGAVGDGYPKVTVNSIPLTQGQQITILPRSSGTSPTIGGGGTTIDFFSIIRTGN
jgi:hypothetical protein